MRKRKNFDWVTVFIIFGLFLFIASIFLDTPLEEVKEMNYSDLIQKIENNEVKSIVDNEGEQAEIELNDGSKYLCDLPAQNMIAAKYDELLKEGKAFEYKYVPIVAAPWWASYLPLLVITVIFILFWLFVIGPATGGGNKALSFGKSRAKLNGQGKEKITFDDVAGVDEEKEELQEIVEFLKSPKKFTDMGARIPKGVLLVGPPGTGKTLLAKAVANETNATFIKIVASEFVKKYIGEGARLVREVFELAKEKAPAIIFIDELDAVAAKRLKSSTSGDREVQRTLMQLLAELDGFESRGDIGIIGATNRPDILDPALLRPGRFDRFIEVPLPNDDGRKQILKIHTKNMALDEEADLDLLSSLTDGLSGADLKAVCTEAGMFAIREKRDRVTVTDFMDAVEKVLDKEHDDEFIKEAGVMFA